MAKKLKRQYLITLKVTREVIRKVTAQSPQAARKKAKNSVLAAFVVRKSDILITNTEEGPWDATL